MRVTRVYQCEASGAEVGCRAARYNWEAFTVQLPSSMSQSPLQVIANTIVAPQAAFDAIRERPRWFIAFIVISVLTLIAGFLSIAATIHATTAQLATDPRMATLPPDRVKSMTDLTVGIVRYTWLFFPLGVLAFTALAALVLLGMSAIFKGDAGFGRTFALAMNVGVIFGISQLVLGLIVAARGPEAFSSTLDVQMALPSLAWLAPGAGVKILTLLAQFQPFSIWAFVLYALGMSTVARISRANGYIAAAIPWAIGIGLAVAFAR